MDIIYPYIGRGNNEKVYMISAIIVILGIAAGISFLSYVI